MCLCRYCSTNTTDSIICCYVHEVRCHYPVILYTFIYTILQLEDLALLAGSIGLFLVLAAVMFWSRKVDWYAYGNRNLEE